MTALQRALLAILSLCACGPVLPQGVAIVTQPLSQVAIYPEREAFATVLSLNDSKIAAEVSARILEIPVEIGQVVERGAVLVRLDQADFESRRVPGGGRPRGGPRTRAGSRDRSSIGRARWCSRALSPVRR